MVAYQAPPSLGFSRQEYWSGVPFSSPKLPYDPTIPLLGIYPEKTVTEKDMQKSKMAVCGGLTNSCEKKRSGKAKEKRKDISL